MQHLTAASPDELTWCAEIVPPHLRNMVYAFDRSFEGAIAACGAPLVGILAERVFGFTVRLDSCPELTLQGSRGMWGRGIYGMSILLEQSAHESTAMAGFPVHACCLPCTAQLSLNTSHVHTVCVIACMHTLPTSPTSLHAVIWPSPRSQQLRHLLLPCRERPPLRCTARMGSAWPRPSR